MMNAVRWELRWNSIGLGVALGAMAGLGCSPSAVFGCHSDGECLQGGLVGSCQTPGYCSFPDDDCESGLRFGTHAGDGLANACVSPDGAATDATTSTSATTSEPPTSLNTTSSSTSGFAPTTDGTTTDGPTTDGPISAGSTAATTSGLPTSSGDTIASSSTGSTTGGEPGCIVEDDFENGVLDPPWEPDDEHITEVSGMLGVELADLTLLDYTGAWFGFDEFDGQTFTVEIGASPPAGGSAQLIIDMDVGYGTIYSFVHEGSLLIVRYGPEGAQDYVTLSNQPFDPQAHRFVRLRAEADTMHWEHSGGGQQWQTIDTIALPSGIGESWVGIWIGMWQKETEFGFVGAASASLCPAPP